MENLIIFLVAAFIIILTILMCVQESKKRKINVFFALLICCLTTPIFAYFIVSSFALRNPAGCQWCGNKENEVEYCGLCGKNAEGKTMAEK